MNNFRVNTVYSYVENMKAFDLKTKHGTLVTSNVTNLLRQNNFIQKILKYIVPYKVFSYYCCVLNLYLSYKILFIENIFYKKLNTAY